MKNIYQVANGIVSFGKDIDPNLYKSSLPAGFYATATTPMAPGKVFLNVAEPLTIPPKIYGDSTNRMNRIINSFKATDKNLGVLLYGESRCFDAYVWIPFESDDKLSAKDFHIVYGDI